MQQPTAAKDHWETVYTEKGPQEVGWTQTSPEPSFTLIKASGIPKDAPIIDVGGGDSLLVDYLLEAGYTDLTVLDISGKALERARERLGPEKAGHVQWIEQDVRFFEPGRTYTLWHDRATFHFLTEEADRARYQELVKRFTTQSLVTGTFSTDGPARCSGLPVVQYDAATLAKAFAPEFGAIHTQQSMHYTPAGKPQAYIFAHFTK
jgi:hypothetical protein